MRDLLAAGRRDDVFVITTKAADFSKRLLAKQQLFGEQAVAGGIKEENIFGLGSGPKQEVLGRLLAEAGEGSAAVFVEDRLLTLDKTMADATLRSRVLPYAHNNRQFLAILETFPLTNCFWVQGAGWVGLQHARSEAERHRRELYSPRRAGEFSERADDRGCGAPHDRPGGDALAAWFRRCNRNPIKCVQ